MTGNELAIGGLGISVVLTILLRMVYNTWEVANRFKPWIAVGLGMALSIVALGMTGGAITFVVVVTYLVQGFMTGATAVGLYEMSQRGAPK